MAGIASQDMSYRTVCAKRLAQQLSSSTRKGPKVPLKRGSPQPASVGDGYSPFLASFRLCFKGQVPPDQHSTLRAMLPWGGVLDMVAR